MNTFFNRYAEAFEAYDVESLLGLFRWPVLLVTTGTSVVWTGPEQARPSLEALLDRYRGWGVERVRVKEVQAEPAGDHHRCVVTWALFGTEERTFRTAYWVAHDEITAVLVIDEPAS